MKRTIPNLACHTFTTCDGVFEAGFTPAGLASLQFPGTVSEAGDGEAPDISFVVPKEWLKLTDEALNRALCGMHLKRRPEMDLTCGTRFQRRVWEELMKIPVGHTVSYGQLAWRIGHPAAVRAVGRACGANPIPLLIPCHRVLAANGRIGGFSGGMDWKRRLLEIEHIEYF